MNKKRLILFAHFEYYTHLGRYTLMGNFLSISFT